MKFDPANFAILPLAESHLVDVIRIAESLEGTPRWPLDSYRELTGKNPSVRRIAFVAQDTPAGEVLGFVIARLTPPEAELESIGVAKALQRRGVGRRLIEALIEELDLAGVEKLYLEVRVSNTAAPAFYRSMGFVETGRRPSYYADPMEDAVLMKFRLRPTSP